MRDLCLCSDSMQQEMRQNDQTTGLSPPELAHATCSICFTFEVADSFYNSRLQGLCNGAGFV